MRARSTSSWMLNPEKACKNEDSDIFITPGDENDEPPYPSPRARELCSRCPVRPDCLEYALGHDIDFGVWGGMSAYQRSLISRKQSRKSCPGCASKDGIIIENNHEICLACGVSWPIW